MHLQCSVHSAAIVGVEAVPVRVEVVVSSGMPGFAIVGMPDAAIQEARERVRAAIRACGYIMPTDKIVVNLAPGSMRKSGSGFDLPIALALLAATNQIPRVAIEGFLIVGELSLEGGLRPVRGALVYEVCARKTGLGLICPQPDDGFIALDELRICTATTLGSFRRELAEGACAPPSSSACDELDYAEVGGHAAAKRALQVAAAGNHGILMMGPPGSGKTMLASRLPSIMPPLDEDEALVAAQIHSVVGEDASALLARRRPFRQPHHSATLAGLTGGGSPVRPGEVSLAHNGVLFLDELAEFKPSALQGIRQPLEDGRICITRAEGNVVFPACFMLVAASNPCPCGYHGDPDVACTCTLPRIHAYQNRIGGPLLDRIDMHIDVWRGDFTQITGSGDGPSSSAMREGVLQARAYASWRLERFGDGRDGRGASAIMAHCRLRDDALSFLEAAARRMNLSARGIIRSLSVARTIADMSEEERVSVDHAAEALSFRLRENAP